LQAGVDERALASRLRVGDSEAVKELYSMYFDRLYAYVFHNLKGDQAATEDIVQNAFVGAIKSARDFKGESKLYTWLVGIANHKIKDFYRRGKREVHLDEDLINIDSSKIQTLTGNGRSIEESIESAETDLAVARALAALPVDYRQVLLLKYVEDMKVLEISRALERSPKAVDGLLMRARKLFKEKLAGDARGKTASSGD
jgi:RNA polymerase sigma-70 factor (ECF subfamily)